MARLPGRARCAGFTLVELLVVIAIIGVLVALLLPAIQAAREAARRSQCQNQLKQFAMAALNHESNLRHFPTGGWGWGWVGDADRGFGQQQPGGWIYNILPFMEQQAKHDLPKDGRPHEHTDPQLEGARKMLVNPIDILNCPSRRNGVFRNVEKVHKFANNSAFNTPTEGPMVGRSDYAANAGDFHVGGGVSGPGGLTATYTWNTMDKVGLLNPQIGLPDGQYYSGIMFQRSEVAIKHITDGTSKTYLCGEKYLDTRSYETGEDTGDNETWCTGHNNDNLRTTGWNDGAPNMYLPRLDAEQEDGNIFGSAHPAGWHVAFCDGHTETLGYDIDPLVHRYNGNRHDGNNPN
ncbi:MAG: hypothetical protein DCC67_04500 [Planctomycetota bacterium]|nr:MAG: hypothetical protein DCC67_04500 [Planctomycetota bacterium]